MKNIKIQQYDDMANVLVEVERELDWYRDYHKVEIFRTSDGRFRVTFESSEPQLELPLE